MKAKILSAALLAFTAASPLIAQNLTGAGATFPNPIYSRWFNEYAHEHPEVHINYQSVGSGAGISQLRQGVVDFGASDMPLTDEMMHQFNPAVLNLPTVLGAVVPTYNVPGVTADLKFSPQVIAGIYLGVITNWNDSNIARENPGVKLPDHSILPVYRSDGSGTTFIFTDFLSKVVPEFSQRVGHNTKVNFPVGIGAKGNEGVAGMVRGGQYSFGYVELIYALENHMTFGLVRNAAGKFVKASTEGVTAAAAADAKNIPGDFRVSITNAPGENSYPISSFTYLLIPTQWKDKGKEKVMVDSLHWMLEHGQGEATGMSYAPLPQAVAQHELQVINEKLR